MKWILSIFVILTVFVIACDHENGDDDPNNNKLPVYAGIINESMLFTELNPPLSVNLEYNDESQYYAGADSLDINSDGSYDLIIDVGIPSIDTITVTPWLYPHTTLYYKNGLEVAVYTEYYPLGLGQYGKIDWVDTLKYKVRIDTFESWSEESIRNFMWVVPPAVIWGSNGCWYEPENAERYIGIRMKHDTLFNYGWIRVNEISNTELEFLSYAIEK